MKIEALDIHGAVHIKLFESVRSPAQRNFMLTPQPFVC
jgi:hypothetical protein